ncbi:hypothetical protein [Yersinia kristensenii]|uniref:hypothetical protein n=1 Tax=Yersinia kristensenii TaxID=28152 RepID=UPI0005E64FD2|nr:hypothetical protein [Yersinia kristensenii]CNE49267.1 Uncharacterised protein [Yersinia kristensenii]CNG89644.1 Uncharacterised protein [Yersinia kristensenii]CNK25150.1 Uncharacterised protein [Yersinia kristensenii]
MKPIIILIILQLISFSGWSSLYPVLSDIRIEKSVSSFANIYFTQILVDIGPAGDIPIPYTQYDTYMGIGSVWGAGGGGHHFYQASNPVLIKPKDTFSTAALRAYYGGHSAVTQLSTSMSGGHDVGYCVGYAATIPRFGNSWVNGTYYPVGMCILLPPAGEWCKMITPTLVLDHGRLSVKETEGHSASDKLNIQCTTGTSVTLRLMNKEKYIRLSDTARANIFVDGVSIGGSLRLKAGDNLLTISDQLTGITEPGELNGMAVLVIEPA